MKKNKFRILSRKLSVLLIFFIGFLVYFQSLNNGFIIGDDEDQIVNNPLVYNLSNLPIFFTGSTYYLEANQSNYGLFYRPLMLVLYTVIYSFAGLDPFYFHLVQLLFHLANACLVFLIVGKLLSKKLASDFVPISVSLLFLLHPINSETVLHIANLQEVTFLFFGLLCFWFALDRKHVLSVVSFMIALFAKETAFLFLPLLVLYRSLWQRKIPWSYFIGLGSVFIFYLWLRVFVAQVEYGLPVISRIAELSFLERLALVPSVLWFYLKTFIWPEQLVTQQFWVRQSFWKPLFFLTILSSLIAILYKKGTQHKKVILFSSLWLILGLGLHSQILPLYLTVAERWFYFSSVGASLLVVISLYTISQLLSSSSKRQIQVFSLILLILLSLSASRTIKRTYAWKNSETLLKTDVNRTADDFYNENLLATLYIREKEYQLAEPLLRSSINTHPYVGNLSNMAIVLMNQDRLAEAETYFLWSIEKEVTHQAVVNYLNYLLFVTEEPEKASHQAEKYIEIYPSSGELWLIQAISLYQQGQSEKALEAAIKADTFHYSNFSAYVLETISSEAELELDQYIELW